MPGKEKSSSDRAVSRFETAYRINGGYPNRQEWFATYEMELQIPHHPRTQILQEDDLPADIKSFRGHHLDIMCSESRADYGSGGNAGSYPSLRINSTEVCSTVFWDIKKGSAA